MQASEKNTSPSKSVVSENIGDNTGSYWLFVRGVGEIKYSLRWRQHFHSSEGNISKFSNVQMNLLSVLRFRFPDRTSFECWFARTFPRTPCTSGGVYSVKSWITSMVSETPPCQTKYGSNPALFTFLHFLLLCCLSHKRYYEQLIDNLGAYSENSSKYFQKSQHPRNSRNSSN